MKLCAITGGAGALGSALARHLVKGGWKVALYDTDRAKGRLEELAKELGAATFAGDFAQAATWDAALAATRKTLGGAPTHAALIAGGWAGGASLHEAKDDSAYESMMKANVDTAYRALRALLPPMVAAKDGAVVVVGSRAAVRPWTSTGAAAYAASKAAVITLAETVAQEVLNDNVRVNAVMPSTMDTPANRASMPKADPTKWVSLESAAGVIAFLLSEAAKDISGAAIPLYGRA